MPVHHDGVFGIDARTGGFRRAPCCGCCKVLPPPRKGLALLGPNLVDRTLLLLVQMNANSVLFTAFQHITTVKGFPSIAFQPRFDVEASMPGESLSIIGREVNDTAGLVTATSAVRLASESDALHPPRRPHSSSPTNTVRGWILERRTGTRGIASSLRRSSAEIPTSSTFHSPSGS